MFVYTCIYSKNGDKEIRQGLRSRNLLRNTEKENANKCMRDLRSPLCVNMYASVPPWQSQRIIVQERFLHRDLASL